MKAATRADLPDFSLYRLDPLINERAFTEHVRRLAVEGRWLYYHTQDSRRSAPGFPDFVLVRDESIIFAELKVGKGKMSPDQIKWQAALDQVDASPPTMEVHIWRPEDFEAIARRLLS